MFTLFLILGLTIFVAGTFGLFGSARIINRFPSIGRFKDNIEVLAGGLLFLGVSLMILGFYSLEQGAHL